MNIDDFKRVLRAFADEQDDVDVRPGKVVATIRDDVIDVGLSYSDEGLLFVEEHGQKLGARTWMLNRIAKLPQLADRILASVPETPAFVRPSGFLIDDFAATPNMDVEQPLVDVLDTLAKRLNTPIPGATSVTYLTSDAGEGKTTLIGLAARHQAQLLKDKKAQRLLVPIPLGGKSFLTFDDAVIAALVNRLRFPYLYYSAFLELVKMGAVVPAFDGYEEMLIEGNKDEAISALSDLVRSLDSKGSLVVAARKAFFEYQSFRTQARLLDTLGDHSVSFSRLKISRWSKEEFCRYGALRAVQDSEAIYDLVSSRLTASHPLLTRAVLVKRLFDISIETDDRNELLAQLSNDPEDFFFTFVNVIVSREANEKWLNRAGDIGQPLLSVDEHHQLLRLLALEMWQSGTNTLRYDIVDLLVDLFCEARKKPAIETRQVKERIKQHSLLVVDSVKGQAIAFDHEDFQNFFLGEGLGGLIASGSQGEVRSLLTVNILPLATVEQSVRAQKRLGGDSKVAMTMLQAVSNSETGYSYVKENCGAILIWLVERSSRGGQPVAMEGVAFPANSLAGKSFTDVSFLTCHFQPTAIDDGLSSGILFTDCHFERLDIDGASLSGVEFRHCTFDSILDQRSEDQIFQPQLVHQRLLQTGARVTDGRPDEVVAENDERIWQLQRFLRIFLRSTHVDEEVIKLRLGRGISPDFFKQIIPDLIELGVLGEVQWKGGGSQKRYRLIAPLSDVHDALEKSGGSYDNFLTGLRRPAS